MTANHGVRVSLHRAERASDLVRAASGSKLIVQRWAVTECVDIRIQQIALDHARQSVVVHQGYPNLLDGEVKLWNLPHCTNGAVGVFTTIIARRSARA